MDTRKIAQEYRLTHWAGVLREQKASGLSIKDFCKEAGFRENVYFYWQRKLRDAACAELASRTQNEAISCEKALVPKGWAICKGEDSEPGRNTLVVEVNGYHIHIERETNPELVTWVCRALRSLC